MTNAQSKIANAVFCTCKDFHHPWTNKCVNATAGLLLAATPYCLRVYTVVYMVSMLMRGRLPTHGDLKRTSLGILQSTAFLVTNAYTFTLYNCVLRRLLQRYYVQTVAFFPALLASFTAILVERPARRPLLTLYVANVATETLWNMAESRGIVRSIPNGQTLIFGIGISILLYLYRLGLHKTQCKDSLFSIIRILVGASEEGPVLHDPHLATNRCSRPALNVFTIAGLAAAYGRLVQRLKSRHPTCPHRDTCLSYALWGGLKPFLGGITLQVALKLLLNIQRIVQLKFEWRKTLLSKSTLNLGVFLGSFSLLFKSLSCLQRHVFDRDDPRFALVAGFISSIYFHKYPDVTVALYVMWKMLQIVYCLGIKRKVVPRVPGFGILLYAVCTATLFHAGILEPRNLRPSYLKFLQAISGERLSKFNLKPFDAFGLHSSTNSREAMLKLNIVNKHILPRFPMASLG